MSDEKFDAQDNNGSKETAPYAVPQTAEDDVEEGAPRPLMRALESRHMQMIAIVSPPPFAKELPKGQPILYNKSSIRAVLSVLVSSLAQAKLLSMEVQPPSLSAISLSASCCCVL
jgi:hypothetical protein